MCAKCCARVHLTYLRDAEVRVFLLIFLAAALFIFAMLVGRLEVFTVLILFLPAYWRY